MGITLKYGKFCVSYLAQCEQMIVNVQYVPWAIIVGKLVMGAEYPAPKQNQKLSCGATLVFSFACGVAVYWDSFYEYDWFCLIFVVVLCLEWL